MSAFGYHLKKFEDETKEASEKQFSQAQTNRHQEAPQVGRLILLYVDDSIDDASPFGTVRRQAFDIMPKNSLLTVGQRLCKKTPTQMELRWQAVDNVVLRCKKNLRPLVMALQFSSAVEHSPWLAALQWMQGVFSRQQTLGQQSIDDIPEGSLPKRLRPYLLEINEESKVEKIRGGRYEFWIYRQIRKRLDIGELFLNDSIVHRRFSDELVPMNQKDVILKQLDLKWLRQSIEITLGDLYTELDLLWKTFDHELREGKLQHLEYDPVRKHLTWRKPKANNDEKLQSSFYAKLPA